MMNRKKNVGLAITGLLSGALVMGAMLPASAAAETPAPSKTVEGVDAPYETEAAAVDATSKHEKTQWQQEEEAKAAKVAAQEAKEAGDEAKAKQIMDDFKKFYQEKLDEYNKLFCNPYNAAKYGYIDDVIEPRNTRFRVIRALQQLENKKVVNPARKHGNIPL